MRLGNSVGIEPIYSDGYPPTVEGISWAIKQWEPLRDVEGRLLRVFHDVRIEEVPGPRAEIFAYIDPAHAGSLALNQDPEVKERFGSKEALAKSLCEYLERWRPLGVEFKIHVCVKPPVEEGPYR